MSKTNYLKENEDSHCRCECGCTKASEKRLYCTSCLIGKHLSNSNKKENNMNDFDQRFSLRNHANTILNLFDELDAKDNLIYQLKKANEELKLKLKLQEIVEEKPEPKKEYFRSTTTAETATKEKLLECVACHQVKKDVKTLYTINSKSPYNFCDRCELAMVLTSVGNSFETAAISYNPENNKDMLVGKAVVEDAFAVVEKIKELFAKVHNVKEIQ